MSNFKISFLSALLTYAALSFAGQHSASFKLQHISPAQAIARFDYHILPDFLPARQITTSQLLNETQVRLLFSNESKTILLTGQTEESINMVTQQIKEQIDRP